MKIPASLNNTREKRFKRILLFCFFALLIPASILINHAYKQLKLEAYYQYRVMAEELTSRINKHLGDIISEEENRAFTDYSFLNVSGDRSSNLLHRSPLSTYPVKQNIAGIISYFQINHNGIFSTPLLPSKISDSQRFGIDSEELSSRKKLHEKTYQILLASKIVPENQTPSPNIQLSALSSGMPPPQPISKIARSRMPEASQSSFQYEQSIKQQSISRQMSYDAFDKLKKNTAREKRPPRKSQSSLGLVADIAIELPFDEISEKEQKAREIKVKPKKRLNQRARRKEKNILPQKNKTTASFNTRDYSIKLFESEVGIFNIGMLDSGHFVIFRNVWQNGNRQIQGAIIDSEKFIQGTIKSAFMGTELPSLSQLAVAFEGNIYAVFGEKYDVFYPSSTELHGSLLFQSRLNAPLNDMELIYSINTLPTGPGSSVVIWTAAILLSMLCVIFIFIYRLGTGQIKLAQQQQDFVSAVSHELKTPLTSIRMYGEILKEGWADDEKKKTYYNFIYDESERLSRLITNVLQLARMTHNDMAVNLRTTSVSRLLDNIKSKITSQTRQAGFELILQADDALANKQIDIDEDYFIQIIINLVDNAIKFSAKADKKQIDIHCSLYHGSKLLVCVRDYGPGIDNKQMKKIFTLFYRSENEITRETIGTGIGLALVYQLANIMGGEIDVTNRQPGAEFRLLFPVT
ncbi:MAG TPA: HAMP domain-containing histidine kinase [Gammaproteobacteria bacterium]|nr:HAMP domain-containing histidine kinase [Gammaproteobacteria bacterium]